MKLQIFTFSVLSAFFLNTVRASDDFASLWKDVSARSFGISSSRYEAEAAAVGASRAVRHWFPRLLANAQIVNSNDPGTTLFSTLRSRTLVATDLNPDLMNHPSREWFKQGSLVLDWSLFEGGAGVAFERGAEKESEAQALALASEMSKEYTNLTNEYAKLIALRNEHSAYKELKEKLNAFLARYKLGSRDNPVGYSGLLGMQALANRLDGYLDQTQAEISATEYSLKTRSGREGKTISTPTDLSVKKFVDSALSVRNQDRRENSFQARSAARAADAASEFSKAERGRWLPRVGVFTSGNLTSAPRDSGTSVEYGAYLQWELFNPKNIGSKKEATLRAEATRERANQSAEASNISSQFAALSIPALEKNLTRIEDSFRLTSEQVAVTEKLFRNGSINVLQFVEVLSRRTDVVQSRRSIELAYVNLVSTRYLESGESQ